MIAHWWCYCSPLKTLILCARSLCIYKNFISLSNEVSEKSDTNFQLLFPNGKVTNFQWYMIVVFEIHTYILIHRYLGHRFMKHQTNKHGVRDDRYIPTLLVSSASHLIGYVWFGDCVIIGFDSVRSTVFHSYPTRQYFNVHKFDKKHCPITKMLLNRIPEYTHTHSHTFFGVILG